MEGQHLTTAPESPPPEPSDTLTDPDELLEDVTRGGRRFDSPDHQPALIWIMFHVPGEYARHAGHLDMVRELADGVTGE